VAAYGQSDVDRLMADPALVRNRRKIEATIANAQAIVGLHSGGTCLDDVIWGFRPTAHPRPRTFADVPSSTPQSTALAGELRRLGVRWIGPVIAYATMQACGLVNDHIEGCPRAMSG
jgi:DNA-3-methyladenine glycosylase I